MNNKLKCVPFIIKNDNRIPCGYANGYVAVPITHPLYERYYFDDVEDFIDVHGGLTLSEHFKSFRNADIIPLTDDPIPENSWVFGFDTKHLSDNKYNWDKSTCINETLELLKQLEEYDKEN